MSNLLKINICGTNFPEFVIFNRLGENQLLKNFPLRANLRQLTPAEIFFRIDLRKLKRDLQCIFAKIDTTKSWEQLRGVFVFLFKIFPKAAVLMQITFLY